MSKPLLSWLPIAATLAAGCAVAPLTGVPSLSYLGPATVPLPIVPVGPASTTRDCAHALWGLQWSRVVPSHEGVVARALREANADLLVNAQLSTRIVTVGPFAKVCTEVTGTPARFAPAGGR